MENAFNGVKIVKPRRLVIGDIHGRIEALKELLISSDFDYSIDTLIILGDVADGGYNTYQVVEELLKIKNIIYIIGNHDQMFIDYIQKKSTPRLWINQGGANTLNSYGGDVIPAKCLELSPIKVNIDNVNIPVTHKEFFNKGIYYYILDNMLFVHGGFDPAKPIEVQDKSVLLWDRSIIDFAKDKYIPLYSKVFTGHTTTQIINEGTKPLIYNNLYCLDTGAGWTGKLTIMDIDTEEYWQSKIQKPATGGDLEEVDLDE